MRAVSEVLETYSPTLGRDLSELPLADWGDIPWEESEVPRVLDLLAEATAQANQIGLPVVIGGEHTVTIGAVRGIRCRHTELFVIQLDAHLDLRDTYEGRRLCHATVMRRVADQVGLDHIVQCGVRSGTAEEFQTAKKCLHSSQELDLPKGIRRAIGSHPAYVTIDIDVLDPSCAPGTGCPEPGGPSFSDLLSFMYSLRGMRVVGADVTEVLPAADINDITSIAAAKLVREIALLFG